MLRMLPAQQGFGADHLPGLQADLGLIEHEELFRSECMAQIGLHFDQLASAVAHVGAVEQSPARTVVLAAVHRQIGPTEQLGGRTPIARRPRDAQAGRDEQGLTVEQEGAAQTVEQMFGVLPKRVLIRAGVVGMQHDEGIAAPAGQQVARLQRGAQTRGGFDQQIIAQGMTEAVVDLAEAVDVEHQHRDLAPGQARRTFEPAIE